MGHPKHVVPFFSPTLNLVWLGSITQKVAVSERPLCGFAKTLEAMRLSQFSGVALQSSRYNDLDFG